MRAVRPSNIWEELRPSPGTFRKKRSLGLQSRKYHALSDPLRLTILYLLKDQPLCVCVINQFMHISGPKLSYHLTVLKESGLIEGEYPGELDLLLVDRDGPGIYRMSDPFPVLALYKVAGQVVGVITEMGG